ncbi:hypothetical protein C7H19_01495 [Aphanothece hegewaldii CCALA 016]|uniref:Glycoside hydrolase family 5 domain-containing protein n=1 Tax=Aphanothece hegewaldii CCALA 016 TaxID=2107694 RepID=A0A2T1M3S5_9CHRO|nr:cellulase family glycosylhydrolase [Aphanothece hegewaldii]PSF39489.1 hypothetical protein C7H19_01495 [Aphanothece hegewaldii CCALA 016]
MSSIKIYLLILVNTIIGLTSCQSVTSGQNTSITPPASTKDRQEVAEPKRKRQVQQTESIKQSPVRLTVKGSQIFTPEGKLIEWRGVNWGWWGSIQPQDGVETAKMGANAVRLPFKWYFSGKKSDIRDSNAPGNISPEGLALLDKYVDWCVQQKLWVILSATSDEGAGDNAENYWTNPALRKEFFETWAFLVQRYKNKPYIAAYEILNEPHPLRKKYATTKEVQKFYQEAIEVIRQYDSTTPLIVGPSDNYDLNQLPNIYIKNDKNLIYTFNYYEPSEYVKTNRREVKGLPLITYPGTFQNRQGETITLNKEYLARLLQPAVKFREQYNVPLFVNQVGVRSEAPGQLKYIADVLALFDQYKIPYTYWTFKTEEDQSQQGLYWLDEKGNYQPKTELIELLKKSFSRR